MPYMEPAIPTFDSNDPDALVPCPYCDSETIIAKRQVAHIIKCKKNWKGPPLVTCVFNARHLVKRSEFKYHIANCPDRQCIEADIAYMQRKASANESSDGHYSKGCTDLPVYNKIENNCDEDWDAECEADDPETIGYKYHEPAAGQYAFIHGASSHRGKVSSYNPPEHDNKAASNTNQFADNSATYDPIEQPHGTASDADEQLKATRLPRQPSKASAIAGSKGVNIAANIFGKDGTTSNLAISRPSNSSSQNDISRPGKTLDISAPWYGIGRGGHGVSGQPRRVIPGLGRGLIHGDAIKIPGFIKD